MRGGVSERPKEHASKACEVQASQGSNPCATAPVAERSHDPRPVPELASGRRGPVRLKDWPGRYGTTGAANGTRTIYAPFAAGKSPIHANGGCIDLIMAADVPRI